MNQLQQHIQQYFNVNEEITNQLIPLFEIKTVAKGKLLFKESDRNMGLVFLSKGYFRIFRQSPDKEITQWLSSPGEIVCDINSLIFKHPSRWNVQAINECTVFHISQTNYEHIQKSIPEWSQVEKILLSKCFALLEERIYNFLSMTSEERYLFLYELNKALFSNVPQQYLASMLGMTPETFSRIRKKLIS